MMVSLQKGRFGKVDVVVITLALIVFVILVYGMFFVRFKEDKRQSPCLNHLRQLVVTAQLYVQDHDGRWPGADWVADLNSIKALGTQTFQCDADKQIGGRLFISYGYSGLLLRADGSGVNQKQIMEPEEVGVFCDAVPTKTYPKGGIIGGGGLQPRAQVVSPINRHGNDALPKAYADGECQ